MIPLPTALGGGDVFAWRLDQALFRSSWDSGEGAYQFGGRWNSRGVRAVYCSLDPAAAILEVAVHKTFRVLDTVPHVLTALKITDPATVHIIWPAKIPNSNWLRPGIPSAGQQAFGDEALASHPFVLIPSTVSTHSWNLVFDSARAAGAYTLALQEEFALDTRLHPPSS
ncbi:RES family NAD+ phosphorylase [Beijerinckia sp. L45]|uniref:RES family NAD+ phosphorylase n=1 Tax=Beijerinckia sp. L45 TaxID=1641855 RepID=UPI00131E1C24|nr:RES domain-containing protein [Beijerinckia sp. L45]